MSTLQDDSDPAWPAAVLAITRGGDTNGSHGQRPDLDVTYLGERQHLPIVELQTVA